MRQTAILAALLLAACNAEGSSTTASQANQEPAAPAAPDAKAVELEEENELMTVSLAYPSEVAEIPALERQIRAASAKGKKENSEASKLDKEFRDKEGFDFHPYELSDSYSVSGSTDRLLSLAHEWMTFTGGAHPMHGTNALLWDRSLGAEIALADVMAEGAAALPPIFAREFCSQLDRQRAEKRGPDGSVGAPDDPFNQCPDLSEITMIPEGPVTGGAMTRIRFHADPYLAGPYAEGDYDVTLPITAPFIAALKPAYRSSFAAAR